MCILECFDKIYIRSIYFSMFDELNFKCHHHVKVNRKNVAIFISKVNTSRKSQKIMVKRRSVLFPNRSTLKKTLSENETTIYF